MAGVVYLRTNRFDVKLEGITFKAKDFETLCTLDFLFPDGKPWPRPPIVGVDVMRHPRDPNVILLLLGICVGCVILRISAGGSLPEPLLKFLTDERIRFVGFGIPEKKDLFPFEKLGLTKQKVDIGYLAAKCLNDPKYKKSELGELARKTLGIKRMCGLTDSSSFERHEQIKSAICQLFITNVMAMTLMDAEDKKKLDDSPKRSPLSKKLDDSPRRSPLSKKLDDSPKRNSFLKRVNSLPLLTQGWFKLTKGKKDNNKSTQTIENFWFKTRFREGTFLDDIDDKIKSKDDHPFVNDNKRMERSASESKLKSKEDPLNNEKHIERSSSDVTFQAKMMDIFFSDKIKTLKRDIEDGKVSDDSDTNASPMGTKSVKGILKCPSSKRLDVDILNPDSPPLTNKEESLVTGSLRRADSMESNGNLDSPPIRKEQSTVQASLKRANSKGFNVSFK